MGSMILQEALFYNWLVDWPMRPVRRIIAGLAMRLRMASVLDVCCGTGEQCRRLESLGIRASGLDASPVMIEYALRRGGSFVLGDARALPFPAGQFDGVVLSLALHEMDPEARTTTMAEAFRVLRTDGRLLIFDFLLPAEGTRAWWMGKVHRLYERAAGGSHYRNYCHFQREEGGLLGFLARRSCVPEELIFLHGGAAAIVVLPHP